jgi:uncharacterized membrane protein
MGTLNAMAVSMVLSPLAHGAANAGAGLELVVYLIASARATEEKTSHAHDEGVKSRILHD